MLDEIMPNEEEESKKPEVELEERKRRDYIEKVLAVKQYAISVKDTFT